MSIHQSLEQQRASHAWTSVMSAYKVSQDVARKYTQLASKLPAMIANNGLGQTLAFLAAKAKTTNQNSTINLQSAEGQLYAHLEQWLTRSPKKRDSSPPGPFAESAKDEPECATPLLYRITAGDSLTYRHATLESQRLLVWLKLFAAAKREKSEDAKETGNEHQSTA